MASFWSLPHPQYPQEWKSDLLFKNNRIRWNVTNFKPAPLLSNHPLPGGRQKYMVPLYIVLLSTTTATTSKCYTNDLVAHLNYVPPKTEKHFRLSLETGADLVKRQYCKKGNIAKKENNFFLLKWAGFMRACHATLRSSQSVFKASFCRA